MRCHLGLLIAAALLVGCGSNPPKPDLPPPAGKPTHTITVREVYVPVDAALTEPCPIEPAGKPSDAPQVARARKAALEACNGKLEAIRAIQGSPKRNSTRNPTR